jgi:hypothetical protein
MLCLVAVILAACHICSLPARWTAAVAAYARSSASVTGGVLCPAIAPCLCTAPPELAAAVHARSTDADEPLTVQLDEALSTLGVRNSNGGFLYRTTQVSAAGCKQCVSVCVQGAGCHRYTQQAQQPTSSAHLPAKRLYRLQSSATAQDQHHKVKVVQVGTGCAAEMQRTAMLK